MYVLENVSLQLKHQISVLANSNGTDLTEQEMCDSIYASNSFPPFLEAAHIFTNWSNLFCNALVYRFGKVS